MRTHALIAALAAALLTTAAEAKSMAAERTRIDSGSLQGSRTADGAVASFKGIPYAAAPTGNLRFRPPAPVSRWKGVRSAAEFGPMCPQIVAPGTTARIDEDCLTANVWTGAGSSKERRPVFVWIYGGGFSQGTAANPQFDGEALARKGVIVVTFNYRLGPLGFLATPELSRESGHGASGNYGLLDDIALLRWVQRNIAAFGGDPGRVTIGGQSAGAGSVGFLALSPLAKGLFRRAIAQSHVRHPGDSELRYLSTSWRAKAAAEASGTEFVAARGAKSLADLRAMPWQKLLEGSDTTDDVVDTGTRAKPPLFRPVVDGWVIPAGYGQTFARGSQNHVAYLAGNNRDETGAVPESAFTALRNNPPPLRGGMPPTSLTMADYRAWARRRFGPQTDEFLRLYPASNDDEAALMNNQASRDNSRVSSHLWMVGWKRTVSIPTFTYAWGHAQPGPSAALRGSFHGSEIPYVFNSLDKVALPWTAEDRRIADIMSSYWANYIKTGNPNGTGLPSWPAWDEQKAQVMEVGDRFGPIPVATPERISFWRRYFESQTQW